MNRLRSGGCPRPTYPATRWTAPCASASTTTYAATSAPWWLRTLSRSAESLALCRLAPTTFDRWVTDGFKVERAFVHRGQQGAGSPACPAPGGRVAVLAAVPDVRGHGDVGADVRVGLRLAEGDRHRQHARPHAGVEILRRVAGHASADLD